jgi:hypothetical protein
MYQLEVKRWLVAHMFHRENGWDITLDIDAMERDAAGKHAAGKREIARECEHWLRDNGAKIVAHKVYGRADLVAVHETHGTYVVEVEGDSSRQKEQAMYSALAQIVLSMRTEPGSVTYGLAVPDAPDWEAQVRKVPKLVRDTLNLKLLLVSSAAVRELKDA